MRFDEGENIDSVVTAFARWLLETFVRGQAFSFFSFRGNFVPRWCHGFPTPRSILTKLESERGKGRALQ